MFSLPTTDWLALPVDLFNVVVHLDRQLAAASRAPSLQDLAPLGCCHSGAEAVPA
jgi:hypothetical protein